MEGNNSKFYGAFDFPNLFFSYGDRTIYFNNFSKTIPKMQNLLFDQKFITKCIFFLKENMYIAYISNDFYRISNEFTNYEKYQNDSNISFKQIKKDILSEHSVFALTSDQKLLFIKFHEELLKYKIILEIPDVNQFSLSKNYLAIIQNDKPNIVKIFQRDKYFLSDEPVFTFEIEQNSSIYVNNYFFFNKKSNNVYVYLLKDDLNKKPIATFPDISDVYESEDVLFYSKTSNKLYYNTFVLIPEIHIATALISNGFICTIHDSKNKGFFRINSLPIFDSNQLDYISQLNANQFDKIDDLLIDKIDERTETMKKCASNINSQLEQAITSQDEKIERLLKENYLEAIKLAMSISGYYLAYICKDGFLETALKRGIPEANLLEMGQMLLTTGSQESSKAIVYATKVFLSIDKQSELSKTAMKATAKGLIDEINMKKESATGTYLKALILLKRVISSFL